MPRLSLGLGVDGSGQIAPAPAPSGIPVASTNQIIVTDNVGYLGGTITLTKVNSTLYEANVNFNYGQIYCEYDSDNVDVGIYQVRLIKENGYWIYRYMGLFSCDTVQNYNYDISSVLEVTAGIIPITGWFGITITAA